MIPNLYLTELLPVRSERYGSRRLPGAPHDHSESVCGNVHGSVADPERCHLGSHPQLSPPHPLGAPRHQPVTVEHRATAAEAASETRFIRGPASIGEQTVVCTATTTAQQTPFALGACKRVHVDPRLTADAAPQEHCCGHVVLTIHRDGEVTDATAEAKRRGWCVKAL